MDFAVTFVAQEGLLKGSDMPEIANPGLLFDGEHLVWFLGLFCRLVLLMLLSWTAGFSMYILGILAISPGSKYGRDHLVVNPCVYLWSLAVGFGNSCDCEHVSTTHCPTSSKFEPLWSCFGT